MAIGDQRTDAEKIEGQRLEIRRLEEVNVLKDQTIKALTEQRNRALKGCVAQGKQIAILAEDDDAIALAQRLAEVEIDIDNRVAKRLQQAWNPGGK